MIFCLDFVMICDVRRSPVVRLDQNGSLLSSATTLGALFLGGTGHLLALKPRLPWHEKSELTKITWTIWQTDFMANRLQTFCQNRSKSFKVPKIYHRSQPFPFSKLPPWTIGSLNPFTPRHGWKLFVAGALSLAAQGPPLGRAASPVPSRGAAPARHLGSDGCQRYPIWEYLLG